MALRDPSGSSLNIWRIITILLVGYASCLTIFMLSGATTYDNQVTNMALSKASNVNNEVIESKANESLLQTKETNKEMNAKMDRIRQKFENFKRNTNTLNTIETVQEIKGIQEITKRENSKPLPKGTRTKGIDENKEMRRVRIKRKRAKRGSKGQVNSVQNVRRKPVYNKSLPIPIPSLMVAGPPKTGTTTLAFTLNKYPDIWKREKEPQFWVHANYTAQCMPQWTESEWTQFIEQYNRSEVTLSSLQSAIPSVCNVDTLRKEYEMELKERPPDRSRLCRCTNPMNKNKRTSRYLPECWLIEKVPQYSWQPFVSILVSKLLPKTRYLTILRDPAPHVWSNYFHFGGGSAEKMQLSLYVMCCSMSDMIVA